jgi:hypothetical protein
MSPPTGAAAYDDDDDEAARCARLAMAATIASGCSPRFNKSVMALSAYSFRPVCNRSEMLRNSCNSLSLVLSVSLSGLLVALVVTAAAVVVGLVNAVVVVVVVGAVGVAAGVAVVVAIKWRRRILLKLLLACISIFLSLLEMFHNSSLTLLLY